MNGGNLVHRALLNYAAIHLEMLVAPDDPKTYDEFFTLCDAMEISAHDYTQELLCEEFLNIVLPNVYKYELNPSLRHCFDIFELHPNFERVQSGFTFKKKKDRLENLFDTDDYVSIFDFIQPLDEEIAQNLAKEAAESVEKSSNGNTLVVLPHQSETRPGIKTECDEKDAVLLSAALSYNSELSRRILLAGSECHRRLIVAKDFFEQSGKMPKNCKDFYELLDKASEFGTLTAVTTQLYELKMAHDKKQQRLRKKPKTR